MTKYLLSLPFLGLHCRVDNHFHVIFHYLNIKYNILSALCGVQLDFNIAPSESFNISSPWYPRQYPLTQDCLWTLKTSTPGSILAHFYDFDTGLGHDKLYFASVNSTILYDVDQIVIGNDLYRFTGRNFPRSVVMPWSEMQIAWDASVWTAGGRGFALELSWGPSNGKFWCWYNHGFTRK